MVINIDRDAGVRIARMAGDSSVMDTAAAKVLAKARANAARHHRTGEYSDSFKVRRDSRPEGKGVVDRVVYNDHPAARIIEFGHFAECSDGRLGQWVPGQFNLVRAIR